MHTLLSIFTDGNPPVENVNLTVTDENLAVVNSNLMMVDENKDSSIEPVYYNPDYFKLENLIKENPTEHYEELNADRSDVDTAATDYQSLDASTMEYISLYALPGKGREGDVNPKIEVGGKFYAVVHKDKTEKHVYTSLAK